MIMDTFARFLSPKLKGMLGTSISFLASRSLLDLQTDRLGPSHMSECLLMKTSHLEISRFFFFFLF